MTSPNRVDAASPFLGELRSAASKGFDGSVSLTANGNEVKVYLDGGNVIAVHSPQFSFPTRELARAYTGEEPTGEDHLRWLYDRTSEDTEQGRGLDADGIDRIVRDWSYGLLASALTWPNGKVRKNRRDTPAAVRFYPTAWQVVQADVTARVDELVSSWAIVTDFLVEQDPTAPTAEPRPASVACPKLVIRAEGHDLLRYDAPIDEVARNLGTTRYSLLAAAAREILTGGRVSFSVVQPSATAGAYPVPESLEDPSREWASVAATAEVDRSEVVVPAAEHVAPRVEEPEESVESELDSPDFGVDTFLADVQSQDEEQSSVEPELDLELDGTAGREGLLENPIEGGVQLSDSTDVTLPGDHAVNGAEQLRAWVLAAADERERAVRERVRRQTGITARSDAKELLADLATEVERLEVAADETLRSDQEVARAREGEQHAQDQVASAERELERIEVEGEALRHAESSAREQVRSAELEAAAADERVAEAERVLAAARESLKDAQAQQSMAQGLLEQAARVLDEDYAQPLAAATAARDEVVTVLLEPARAQVAAAAAAAQAAMEAAIDLRDEVYVVGSDAETSVRVVKELDDSGDLESDLLVADLRALHERLTAVFDKTPALSLDESPAEDLGEIEGAAEQEPAKEPVEDIVDAEVVDEVDFEMLGLTTSSSFEAKDAEGVVDEQEASQPADGTSIDAELEQQDTVAQGETSAAEQPPAPADDEFAGLMDDIAPAPGDGAASSSEAEWSLELDADASTGTAQSDDWESDMEAALTGAGAGSGSDTVPPAPSFDQVLNDTVPQTSWDGSTAQWGRSED